MQPQPTTVMVIEKHPLMRAAIVNAIADEPDLTIGAIAANGFETMQIVENLQPRIILFAIGNPGVDDLDMMRELHKRVPTAVVLALISDEVDGQSQSALEYGADMVLAKTASRAELLHTLRLMKVNMEGSEENSSHVHRRGSG
jgi:DNA-binding NarL/FixJ family response regulator